jgi:hypothetical protein
LTVQTHSRTLWWLPLVPALAGGVFAAVPLAAPVKLLALALLMAGMSGLLLGLSAYEVSGHGRSVGLAWFLSAAGFACLAAVLWLTGATWDTPRAEVARGSVLLGLAAGAGCLAAGTAALWRAARPAP